MLLAHLIQFNLSFQNIPQEILIKKVCKMTLISGLKAQFQNICAENNELKREVSQQNEVITSLEIELTESLQYNRRNNLEISGIEESVTDDELENAVISISESLGIDLKKDEIEGFLKANLQLQKYQLFASLNNTDICTQLNF